LLQGVGFGKVLSPIVAVVLFSIGSSHKNDNVLWTVAETALRENNACYDG